MSTSSPRLHLAIVARDRRSVFETLKARLEEPGVVEVVWDRRTGDRRAAPQAGGPDRRRAERRGAPPATWITLGFLLAPRRDGVEEAHTEAAGLVSNDIGQ